MAEQGFARSVSRSGPQQLIATFDDYAGAQRLVDRMSDDGFPVEHVRIVGDNVRTVEQVTGRLTRGRAAMAGAAWGAIFGFVAHWSTRGERDFASVTSLQAESYHVYVDATHAGQAARYQLKM